MLGRDHLGEDLNGQEYVDVSYPSYTPKIHEDIQQLPGAHLPIVSAMAPARD